MIGSQRSMFFVCSAIRDQELISQTIKAMTQKESDKLFEKQFGILPQISIGPFYRARIRPDIQKIVFTGQSRVAIYDDWVVNALLVKEPENCAFLLFERRVDGKKITSKPSDTIVKLDELREIEICSKKAF